MTSLIITILAGLVFVVRLCAGKLKWPEVLLAVTFVLHWVCIQGSILAMYGCWGDLGGPCWRYHFPSVPIIIAFVAFMLAELSKRYRIWRWMVLVAIVAAAAGFVGQGVRTRMALNGYGRDWKVVNWAVEAIRNDWRGGEPDNFKCNTQEYKRIGRPLVLTCTGIIPYLSGGRVEFDMRRGVDYILDLDSLPWLTKGVVTEKDLERYARQYEVISTFYDGKHQHKLYRRKK